MADPACPGTSGYVLVDITLRMLQPPELKRAQGFDESYIIDRGLFVDPVTGAELSSRFSSIRLIPGHQPIAHKHTYASLKA